MRDGTILCTSVTFGDTNSTMVLNCDGGVGYSSGNFLNGPRITSHFGKVRKPEHSRETGTRKRPGGTLAREIA
eukprot:1314629-Rhodomonas_salina.1